MTNFEFIHSMDIDTLAKFLDTIGFEDTPWVKWFERKYCSKCESIKKQNDNEEHEFSYCELEHKCRFVEDDSWEDPVANVLAWLRSDDNE